MTHKRALTLHVLAIWAGIGVVGAQMSQLREANGQTGQMGPSLDHPALLIAVLAAGVTVSLLMASLIAWAPGAALDAFCKTGVRLHLISIGVLALAALCWLLHTAPAIGDAMTAVNTVGLLIGGVLLAASIVVFAVSAWFSSTPAAGESGTGMADASHA